MNITTNQRQQKNENETFIIIGGKRFHYTWLRDHCLSAESRNPSTLEKLDDPHGYPYPPKPLSVEEEDGKLIIEWDEKPSHRSIFPISWLLSHAYDPQPEPLKEPMILWDKAWIEEHSVGTYNTSSSTRDDWMKQLFQLGFVLLRNIAPKDLDTFIASFGPIRSSEYGSPNHYGIVDLDAAKNDQAGSTDYLPPHTDLTFWHGHRVAAFLYCLQHEASGGDTFVLDAYRVANDFRENNPDDFQLLVETPVQFCRVQHNHKLFYRPTSTIIQLDGNKEVEAIRFSHKNLHPNLPFDQVERFYEAYRNFSGYINNPKYQCHFHLEPGDCLLMQNFRVLHGRTAFDLSSGNRKIKVGYVEWDYFLASYFYQQEFGQLEDTLVLGTRN